MDSGNSSSMQSSSGGGDQEEFDSRADDQSISAFFNNNNNTTITTVPTNLDSLIANYLNTGWSTDTPPPPPLWSTTPKLDASRSVLPPTQPISSSQPQQQQQIFFTNTPPLQQNLRGVSDTNTNTNTNTSTSPMCSVPTDKKNCLTTTRNPKKRSRVSKRAPTTVLTTDTSNFRAMVQEFTGNPSTPFTGLLPSSSTFPRSRFDHLFSPSSSSTTTTSMASSSSSSRPFKPFPHKPISPYLIPPPSSDYHQNLLLNMNSQNITNPFLNTQSSTNPLNLGTSFGHVDVGTNNFEGLHNIITSSSTQQPTTTTLNVVHGSNKNSSHNDLLRSINGNDDHQSMVQRSDESGSEVRRNEGMVELSWISSSD